MFQFQFYPIFSVISVFYCFPLPNLCHSSYCTRSPSTLFIFYHWIHFCLLLFLSSIILFFFLALLLFCLLGVDVKKNVIVTVSSDKGLCGGINSTAVKVSRAINKLTSGVFFFSFLFHFFSCLQWVWLFWNLKYIFILS